MAREVHHTGSTLSTDSPASRAATQSATVRTNWFWPGFVITLLGTQVVLILVMAYVASYDRSFAVEPDYYQQALHWNAHQAQTRANQALGWRVEMGVSDESDVYRNRGIRCTISDRTGNPIDGCARRDSGFLPRPRCRSPARDTGPAGDGTLRWPTACDAWRVVGIPHINSTWDRAIYDD